MDSSGVGGQVRVARKALGWSQRRLAEASGVAVEHLCRLERGQVEPRISTLEKLAAPLGLRVVVDLEPASNGRRA
jgi:transcriptional regulator with XRE-family HTH domain